MHLITSDVDGVATDPGSGAQRESRSMRNVNLNMRQRLESAPASDPVPFFCECGDPTCFGGIWLSLTAFDARIEAESGWLLLEDHRASGLWYHSDPIPTRETVRARDARVQPLGATSGGIAARG